MVSFRYHLTSLAAALLALAVGIVVGTTSLSAEPAARTPAAADLAGTSSASSVSSSDVSADDLAARLQPRVLSGALPDQRVLLLLAPDAPAGSARSVAAALRSAGASVSGQAHLLPTLLDASGAQTVDGVVAATAPPGLALPSGGLERAGALLASALVTSERGSDLGGLAGQKVLGGFTGGSLVSFEGPAPARPATLVLLLAGPARGAALATLAASFQSRVGTVVAAPAGAARGAGVVAVLRARGRDVSDVDGLGTPTGLLATVLALAEQDSGGSGHYGTGPGADALVPSTG